MTAANLVSPARTSAEQPRARRLTTATPQAPGEIVWASGSSHGIVSTIASGPTGLVSHRLEEVAGLRGEDRQSARAARDRRLPAKPCLDAVRLFGCGLAPGRIPQ